MEILPQRPPFVMVDRLVEHDGLRTVTALEVKPDNLMCDEGRFSSAGLIENMAQTCAARIGYEAWLRGENIRIGVIGAVSNMTVYCNPPAGCTLRTTIEVECEVIGMTMVSAQVCADGTVVAEARMKIALTDKEVGNE